MNDNKNSDISSSEVKNSKKIWTSPKIYNLAQRNMSGAEGKPFNSPTEFSVGSPGGPS